MKLNKPTTIALRAAALSCSALLAQGATAAPAEAQFDKIVDDYVFGSLVASPVTASTVGYHQHHGRMLEDELDDFSAAGIKASLALQRDIEARIAQLDPKSLTSEQRADVDIIQNAAL